MGPRGRGIWGELSDPQLWAPGTSLQPNPAAVVGCSLPPCLRRAANLPWRGWEPWPFGGT